MPQTVSSDLKASRKGQRWLILAHAFNMDGRAASHTITDKLPHLIAAGIEVVVLSGVSGTKDASIEHYQVWPAGPAGIRFELRHVLQKRFEKGIRYRLILLTFSLVLLPALVIEKLIFRLQSSWSWGFSAYLKARLIAKAKPFDLIYSTGGAYCAHAAAKHLKTKLNLPWMAEVHDPMVDSRLTTRDSFSRDQLAQVKVERDICRFADVSWWFTDRALEQAASRHPELKGRGHMLLPGVDSPFEKLAPYVPNKELVIGHFGSLAKRRNLVSFLMAVEQLSQLIPEFATSFKIDLYGGPLDPVSKAHLNTSIVGKNVQNRGRLETDPETGVSGRDRVIERMRRCDILLLLHGDEPVAEEYIPSKLYEYLWMQRPIFALVNDNHQMRKLLEDEGHFVVFRETKNESVDQTSLIVTKLQEIYLIWRERGLPDSGKASPYTTAKSVEKILEWAHELVPSTYRGT
jgi:glycosyltransferase involved in cell wall biosynthesis